MIGSIVSKAVLRVALAGAIATTWVVSLASAAPASPPAGTHVTDCPECGEMVVIPPGRFRMGSEGGEPGRPEGPVREVRIARPFLVGVTSVTNAQFARFIAETGYQPGTDCVEFVGASDEFPTGGYKTVHGADWRDPGYGRKPKGDEPVVCVSWLDAKAYIAWLSRKTGHRYRLLSEAEWEYIARAGARGRFPWGDDPEAACRYGNFYDRSGALPGTPWPHTACSDGFPKVAPVGSFPPNAFGVYDVIGNTWQWVEDCYVAPYPAAPVDGAPVEVHGACPLRSVRGASWATTVARARPSFRGRDPETRVSELFGFRIARDLSPEDLAGLTRR